MQRVVHTYREGEGFLPNLSIVVPCFNEEEVLEESTKRFCCLLENLVAQRLISDASHVLYVDDGSRDRTWALITQHSEASPRVRGLKLSRNQGHQRAVLAGLLESGGDLVVSIDADLQDDVTAIEDMVKLARDGVDVVYGVRTKRTSDSAFKRATAEGFYRFMAMLGVETVFNHADFRLMSRRAVEAFREFGEVNLFLRGMMPMLGFRSAVVNYERTERFAGQSKYPLRKMLSLAWEGVTSLSVRPLRLITSLGLLIALASFGASLWTLAMRLSGHTVDGWASIMVAIFFLSGIQLVATGVIGEYVGKIYLETKRRPRYIIDARTE